jgi:hypothetical protein
MSQRLAPLIAIDDREDECYLNLPPDSAINNPLDMDVMKEQQDADNKLQDQATKNADHYICKSTVDDVLLCYVKPGAGDPPANPPANWKIACLNPCCYQ